MLTTHCYGKVYLAGPIKGLSFNGANNWRERFKAILAKDNIFAYSPLRSKDYLQHETKLNEHYDAHPLSQKKTIISRDHFDVMHADLVIANLMGAERISIGTCFELAWAMDHQKPIILMMEESCNVHEHDWIRSCASTIVSDEKQALELIRSFLIP